MGGPKPTNIAELKTCLASIWNDLPQEFTDKQSCYFERDFDFGCSVNWATDQLGDSHY